MSRSFRFAYAPAPEPDELLGSWVRRLAAGQRAVPEVFLRSPGAPADPIGDLDWQCSEEMLNWLAAGSGHKREVLAAMTLSRRFPSLPREAFPFAYGSPFPGCHAYCPCCQGDIHARRGEQISRAGDAGLFRLVCRTHGMFLDDPDPPQFLAPHYHLRRGGTRPGRLAPKFVMAFDRALARAAQGRPPGAAWLVQEPAPFLAVAHEIASLMLVQRRPGAPAVSGAFNFLGEVELTHMAHGGAMFDTRLVDRLGAWARVRGFAAAALVLLKPSAAQRFHVEAWARCWVPYSSPVLIANRPWFVASEAWRRTVLEDLLAQTRAWPPAVAEPARVACVKRLEMMGARPELRA